MNIHNNISLAILIFIVLAMLQHSCLGQNSPQDFVNAHNSARSQVGGGVGNIVWDENVANYARNYVNSRLGDCNLVHSTNSPYGENLAKGSGDFTGQAAVNLWVAEKPFYNYGSNTCVGESVATILKWCGATRSDSVALGLDATMDGGSFLATIVLRATTLANVLIEGSTKGQ